MASSTAQIAKDKGNTSFKSGNWAEAIGHYSAAVLADRTEPTYPLNRAAAYLKLGKHRDAERDCTTVLSLDSKNVKAFFRRSQARVALERFPDAEKDLLEALKIEPANASIKNELAVVQKRKLEAAQKQPSSKREPITVPPLAAPSQPKVILKPEIGTSPSRRITRNVPIEIVEPDTPASAPQTSPDFLKPIHSRVLSPSPSSDSPTPSTPASNIQPRVGGGIFRADGRHIVLRAPTSGPTPSPTSSSHSSPTPAQPTTSNASAPTPLNGPVPPPPLTHFAFSRAWNALPTPQERYSLLARILPGSLPALFQNSLEPELLVSILRTFNAVASPTTSVTLSTYMSAFPLIPRFSTMLLFLSSKEKEIVQAVWDAIDANKVNAGRHLWGI